jgi:CTP synthase
VVEVVELDRSVHPFFLGTQYHPEFTSRPTRANPAFAGFVGAALLRHEERTGRLSLPELSRA